MTREHACALALFINRGLPIIPMTGAEWHMLQPALAMIEMVANGQMVLTPNAPPQTGGSGENQSTPQERPKPHIVSGGDQ